jgi:hypothetical protein
VRRPCSRAQPQDAWGPLPSWEASKARERSLLRVVHMPTV